MRVAVTGASGFIGRHLAAALAGRGDRLRLLVRSDCPGLPGETVVGALDDPASQKSLLAGADLLFHLASALGSRSLGRGGFFAVNRDGTQRLLQAAADSGVGRVVHFSSAGVYGRSSGLSPLAEDAPLRPVDAYEESKLAGERAALDFSGRLSVTVLRPGWVYGEGDRRTLKLIRRIARGPFFIPGAGRVRQATIHVSDVVRLALILAERGRSGEVYNSGGENLSVDEIVAGIAAATGRPRRFLHLPLWLVRPAASAAQALFSIFGREAPLTPAMLAFFRRGKPLAGEKVLAEFGFRPDVPFALGMARAVAWYRGQGWL